MASESNKQALSNEKQTQGKRVRKNKKSDPEPRPDIEIITEPEEVQLLEVIPATNTTLLNQPFVIGSNTVETVEVNEVNDDNNDDGSIKTKRRGRKPKDKFKYETADIDEYARNNKKDDNVIIKLPLSCLKLNEEFNLGTPLSL